MSGTEPKNFCDKPYANETGTVRCVGVFSVQILC
jgi:hypothetical protein